MTDVEAETKEPSLLSQWVARHLHWILFGIIVALAASLIAWITTSAAEAADSRRNSAAAVQAANEAKAAAQAAKQNELDLVTTVTCIESWANQFTNRSNSVGPALTGALLEESKLLATLATHPDDQALIARDFAATNKAFQDYAKATHMHAVPTLQTLNCEAALIKSLPQPKPSRGPTVHSTATKTVPVPGPTVFIPGPTIIKPGPTVTEPPGHAKH